ncbi:bifunctional riboflavin kinase/FAD synthetase [bacterium]|nr:bifunctional riboflavin kinase/FAD synthetase [bacterium]
MLILKSIAELENFYEKTALTVGTFDGIHLGHRRLIERLFEKAKAENLKTALVTFSPHPQEILQNRNHPEKITLLNSLDEKIFLLEKTGLDVLLVIPFSLEFAETSAEDFCRKILIDGLNASEIVIGYDHTFGKNREGSLQTLKKLSQNFGYGIELVEELTLEHEKINSTKIRKLLNQNLLSEANKLLGSNYLISGEVVKGEGRGKNLGFPTANLKLPENKLVPQSGVYAVTVDFEDKAYKGILNIGTRPTFDGKNVSVEVFIFDFAKEIYGKNLRLGLIKKIREEVKFESVEKLKSQIQNDVAEARVILKD